MATITTAIRKSHGSWADLVPAQICKSIPQDELLDRLAHAADLDRRSRQADSQLRDAYELISKAMLGAQPRETTERAVAEYYAQALRTPDARRAAAMRNAAATLLERNPVAPRRADVAIAKGRSASAARPITNPARIVQRVAKAGGKAAQVAVYDADGNLVGIADPADITPLADVAAPSKGDDPGKAAAAPPAAPSAAPGPPADAGTPADEVAKIAKAAAVLKQTFTRGATPAEQNKAAAQLNAMAIVSLEAIHARGSRARPRPARGR